MIMESQIMTPIPFSRAGEVLPDRDTLWNVTQLPIPSEEAYPRRQRPALPAIGERAVPPQPQPSAIQAEMTPDEIAAPADFTDQDLAEALRDLGALVSPVAAPAAVSFSFTDPSFEAALRTNFRRALAEHAGGAFANPGFSQRASWRMQSLFSSRSYEEMLEEKTRRYRVEEVYLIDADRLSMISYASTNPGRHVKASKVDGFAQVLATQAKPDRYTLHPQLYLDSTRTAVVREGQQTLLIAVVIGEPNELMNTDLDHIHYRIEQQFEQRIRDNTPLLTELQHYLEDALLIRSPGL
jgi:hypothetical protein